MDRAGEQLVLILFLLGFYCLAPFLALAFTIASIGPGGDLENDILKTALTTLAADPNAYTAVLHQMIVPVIAAITAANYKSLLAIGISRWLFLVPLLTIFVCIINALVFKSIDFGSEFSDRGSAAFDPRGAVSQLFLNMASTLAVYVMLLVGLKVGNKE